MIGSHILARVYQERIDLFGEDVMIDGVPARALFSADYTRARVSGSVKVGALVTRGANKSVVVAAYEDLGFTELDLRGMGYVE